MNRKHLSVLCAACCAALFASGCGDISTLIKERVASVDDSETSTDNTGSMAGTDTAAGTENSEGLDVVTTPGKAEATTASKPVKVKKSILDGKKVSILGDSISTYTGYIPADYSIFYPENGGITNVNDTWWMRVINGSNAKFCADASYSGSTTCGISTEQNDGRPGVSDRRLRDLTAADGTKPDVILVYMGANDLLVNKPIGDNDGTRTVAEGDIENFTDAYTLMLDKVKVMYPNAQVYCMTFHEICRWDESGKGYTFKSDTGFISSQYNYWIKLIAKNKGLPLIDVYSGSGINPTTSQELTLDGTHPNAQGAAQIANCILRGLDKMSSSTTSK